MAGSLKKTTLAVALLASLCSVAGSYAVAATFDLPLTGRLTEKSGKPIDGPVELSISFFHVQKDGAPVATVTDGLASVSLQEGIFQVTLSLSAGDWQRIFPDTAQPVYVEVTDVTHAPDAPYARFQVAMAPLAGKVPVDGKTIAFDDDGRARLVTAGASVAGKLLSADGAGGLVWVDPPSNTVTQVSGVSAANVALGANAANGASSVKSGGTIVKRDDNGGFEVGSVSADSVTLTAATATSKPLTVKATAAQTADLQQWLSSTGSLLAGIGADGSLKLGSANNTVSLKAPAGISGSISYVLPATPANGKFLTTDANGILSWVSLGGGGDMARAVFDVNNDSIVDASADGQKFVTGSGWAGAAPLVLTTLGADLAAGATTATVVSTAGYPSAGLLVVGNEVIRYTGLTGTTFTGLTRGVFGTTDALQTNGATVNNLLFSAATSASTPKVVVTGDGRAGIGTIKPGAMLETTSTTDLVTQIVRGSAGQTAALQQWQANNGTVLSYVNKDGGLALKGSDTANYVTLKAGAGMAGNLSLTLPPDQGASGSFLTNNGSGVLSWSMATAPASGTIATIAGSETLTNKTLDATSTITGATAASLTNGAATITLPTATGTLVTLAGTETLTNKTISGGSMAANAGTAAAPSVSFSGDTDTGVWSSGANTINLSTGGSERLRVDASGNVGIGTTSPAATLHVKGSSVHENDCCGHLRIEATTPADYDHPVGHARFRIATSNAGADLSFFNSGSNAYFTNAGSNGIRFGLGTVEPSGPLHVVGGTNAASSHGGPITLAAQNGGSGNTDGGDIILLPGNASGTGAVGNVGIGTTSPTAKLHINAPLTSAVSNNDQLRIEDGATGGYFSVSEGASGSSVYIPTFRGRSAGINGVGILVSGTVPAANDTKVGGLAAVVLEGSKDTAGTWGALTNADILAVTNYGTTLLNVQADGNVGIGTTSPGALLDVNGSIRFGTPTTSGSTRAALSTTGNAAQIGFAGGTQFISYNVSGNLDFTSGALGISFDSAHANGSVRTLINGVEAMRVTTGGNVGIGTTSPAYALDVNGAIRGTSFISTGATSSPGAGNNSEKFGANAAAAGTNGTAFGNAASAAGSGATAFGYNAVASQNSIAIGLNASTVGNATHAIAIGIGASTDKSSSLVLGNFANTYGLSTVIGINASASGNAATSLGTGASSAVYAVSMGYNAQATGTGSLAFGTDSLVAHSGSVGFGLGATSTAANQFVAGSSGYPINTVYFGKGPVAAAPTSYTIGGTGGDASGVAGGDIALAGGLGGSAADSGGSLLFKTAAAASGTTLSERMRVSSSGNVGIGTTNPTYKLEVSGNFATNAGSGVFKGDGTGAGGNLQFWKDATPTKAANVGMAVPGGALTDDFIFSRFDGTSWSEAMRILGSTGNVGIGTTSPSATLHAKNTLYLEDVSLRFGANSGNTVSQSGSIYNPSGLSVKLFSNSGTEFGNNSDTISARIGGVGTYFNTGNVGIGTTSPLDILEVSNSSSGGVGGRILVSNRAAAATGNEADIGFKVNSNFVASYYSARIANIGTTGNLSDLAFYVYDNSGTAAGVEKMRISNSGNVGIGTSTPQAPLEIGTPTNSVGLIVGQSSGTSTNGDLTSIGFRLRNTSGGSMYGSPQYYDALVGSYVDGAGVNQSGLAFYTRPDSSGIAERMRIDHSGNVGVGTTSPSYKLDVSGTLHASGAATLDSSLTVGSGTITGAGNNLTIGGGTANGYTAIATGNGVEVFRAWGSGNPRGFVGYSGGLADSGARLQIAGADSTSGAAALAVINSSSASLLFVRNDGNVGIGTTTPGYTLEVAGIVAGNAAYVNTSDIRLKKDIETLSGALAKLDGLRGVTFSWKDAEKFDDRRHLGVVAQEVEAVYPEAVVTGADGVKRVAYSDLVPVLIEAVKDLKAENALLKAYLCDRDPAAAFCAP